MNLKHKKCEGCGLKRSNFGLPAEGKKRWCSGCAKAHVGVVDLNTKKCEGCGLTRPKFGLPAEGKKRWCAGCAKGHAGAVDVNKKCEGCQVKQPHFWLPAEGRKRRWCAGCAPKAATSKFRLEQAARGSLPKRKATAPPSDHFRTLNLCSGSKSPISPGDRKSL